MLQRNYGKGSGHKQLLCETDWPKYDEKHLVQDKITLAIQVNGKLRATHDFSI
jgi:leucyl-tRNA synthetase